MDFSPTLVQTDNGYVGFRYFELLRQCPELSSSGSQCSDSSYLFICKFRIPSVRSSFEDSIQCVIKRRSNEKMARPNAWRVVAFMAQEFSFWNLPLSELPKIPMGSHKSPFSNTSEREIPVSTPISFPFPDPTTAALSYFRNESFFDAFVVRCFGALSAFGRELVDFLSAIRALFVFNIDRSHLNLNYSTGGII